jgi:hypothetical protein
MFDINVRVRNDYLEMFASRLLSVFVCERSMSFYLFVLNRLVGSLDSLGRTGG